MTRTRPLTAAALALGTALPACTGIIGLPGGRPPIIRTACQIHHAVCYQADPNFEECVVRWVENGQPVLDFLYPYLGEDPSVPGNPELVPQSPLAYDESSPMAYKVAASALSSMDRTNFGPGDWACDPVENSATADDVCARLCGSNRQAASTEMGRANPALHAPLVDGGAPYCVAFQVESPGTPSNLCRPPDTGARSAMGRAVAGTTAPAAADERFPGNPRSADLYVTLAGQGSGTNTISIEGAAGDIPVDLGYASFKLPDPFCRQAGPCMARLNHLEIRYVSFAYSANGQHFDIVGLSVYLPSALDAVVTRAPGTSTFVLEIPAGTIMYVVGEVNGEPNSLEVPMPDTGYITYDPSSGIVAADLAWSATVDDVTVAGTTFVTTVDVGNRPPDLDAGSDLVAEVTDASCEVTVDLEGAVFDPDANLVARAWASQGRLVSTLDTASTTLPLGDHLVTFQAIDAFGSRSRDDVGVEVRDATLPEFVDPAELVTLKTCDPTQAAPSLPLPVARNLCNDALPEIAGVVTEMNGTPTDIPLEELDSRLPLGVHTVLWSATNENGTVVLEQRVHVVSEPTLFATRWLTLGTGASITSGDGGYGTLMNTDTHPGGATSFGLGATAGDVLTLAPLVLGHGARVSGAVLHGGSVDRGLFTAIEGPLTEVKELPGIDPPLDPPAFSGGADVTVTNRRSLVLSAGSYGRVRVQSGGTLVLSAGAYTFEELDVKPYATLVVPDAPATTVLFVADELELAGQVVDGQGAPAPLLVGYAGRSEVSLRRPFWGVVAAPNATLTLQPGGIHDAFVGRFYARDVRVGPAVRVEHDTLFCEPAP